MINKPLFESELVDSMLRKLASQDTDQAMISLSQAAENLNCAVEILEELGMHTKAEQILDILIKIASTNVSALPSMEAIQWVLDRYGLTIQDINELNSPTTTDNRYIKAKVSLALRQLGHSDDLLERFFGAPLMSREEAVRLLKNKKTVEEMVSVTNPEEIEENIEPGSEISFKSLAKHNKPKRPADPRKISDRYTKGLTPDQMIKNLLDHGTMFHHYHADDGLNTDDSLESDDSLLDIDLDDDNNLEVSEADGISSFEDERDI